MKIPRQKDVAEYLYGDDKGRIALFKAVVRKTHAGWDYFYDNIHDFLNASGGIPGFTYYHDTEPFAKRHIEQILYLVKELEDMTGECIQKPDSHILNWYAWFAIETIANDVLRYKEDNEMETNYPQNVD